MKIEKLEAENFGCLKDIHDGFSPDPRASIALIAREGEEIIGRVFLVSPTHIEGPWVKPEYRGSLVGASLMKEIERQAIEVGISTLLAYAANETLAGYLRRLGYKKQPLTVFKKEIQCRH